MKGKTMSDDFTVGDLRSQLAFCKDSDKLTFSGGLTFYRVKSYGDDDVNIEFNEPQAYLDEQFKKRNPNVKVAFIRTDNIEWNEEGTLGGPVDVSVR
jgi:hypothetical protein